MRTIERGGQFKRDYKRDVKGRHGKSLDAMLVAIIQSLANDETLELHYHDHALFGDWKDHRDCHVKPHLILIYRKPNADTLQLVRLGSHSELEL